MDEPLGTRIRRARLEAGYSQAELARRVYVDKAYLSRVENGHQAPSPALLRALSNTLGVRLGNTSTSTYPWIAHSSDSDALVPVRLPDGSVIFEMMDRRAFLATASMAGAAAVIPLPDRVTPDVITAVSDRLNWHVTASRVNPPGTMSRLLQADLTEITRAARNAPAELRPALLSLGSRYAEHLGWMRQEADDIAGALYWTNHAADLAHTAGWRHMVAYTLARKGHIIQREQPEHAADLSRAARTNFALPPGMIVYVASQEAEAYAYAGNTLRADRSIDLARRAAERADPNEPLPAPQLVDFGGLVDVRSARCDVLLGRPEAAIKALAPIVADWTTPRSVALYGPRLALAYAQAGAVDEACAVALESARNSERCGSEPSRRDLRALRAMLRPWAGRDEVRQVLDALPA